MDFNQELTQLACNYQRQGYEVVAPPLTEDLPPFASSFRIQILARRGDGGVLVAVKKNRDELAADDQLIEYARLTAEQPGWRFDLAVVEPGQSNARDINGAQDYSADEIERVFVQSEEMVNHGYIGGAVVSAWGAFESSMRMKLRADGKQAGWGSSPRTMVNELYSHGVVTADELPKLETLYRVRNQVVHGFLADLAAESGAATFLHEVGRRLIAGSQATSSSVG